MTQPRQSDHGLLADWAAGLAVPAVPQLDDPAAGGGAGDQVESVGLGDAVEQPGALARNVGEQAHLGLVDPGRPPCGRPPEADAPRPRCGRRRRLSVSISSAVSPAAMVVLAHSAVFRVREKTTLRAVFGIGGEGVVGGRCCHGLGDGLVGGAAHDVRVRALEKVELRRIVQAHGFRAGRSRTSNSVPSSARRPSSE